MAKGEEGCGGSYLRCELFYATHSMGSGAIKEGIARVVFQTCKCPQHIGQRLRIELLHRQQQSDQACTHCLVNSTQTANKVASVTAKNPHTEQWHSLLGMSVKCRCCRRVT